MWASRLVKESFLQTECPNIHCAALFRGEVSRLGRSRTGAGGSSSAARGDAVFGGGVRGIRVFYASAGFAAILTPESVGDANAFNGRVRYCQTLEAGGAECGRRVWQRRTFCKRNVQISIARRFLNCKAFFRNIAAGAQDLGGEGRVRNDIPIECAALPNASLCRFAERVALPLCERAALRFRAHAKKAPLCIGSAFVAYRL